MKKRILSIFVALALSLSLLPATAFAEDSPYGVYVGDTAVTDSNKSDILGDGATAYYDTATNTLTLDNFNGTSIYAERSDFTIKLVGDNTINFSDGVPCKKPFALRFYDASATNGKCKLTGDGNLTINANTDKSALYCWGGELTLDMGGDLNITCPKGRTYSNGIYTNVGMIISSTGNININTSGSGGIGIYCEQGSLDITGSCDINITASQSSGIYCQNGSLNITGKPKRISITTSNDYNAISPYKNIAFTHIGDYTVIGDPKSTSVTYLIPIHVTGVTLNKETTSINVGASETLTATVAPEDATDKTVTWNSSNDSVATVDSTGRVTAVAEGTATITAATQDGNKTATCDVTVVVPVASVSLDKTTAIINVGNIEKLTATVSPDNASNKTVTWTSSDTSVATVDTIGNVTAVAPGTATIKVTTQDGNKTATCDVTVVVPVASVSLNKTTATINVGNTEALTAEVAPSNATNKTVTWSSNNTSVATVDNTGVVTAVAAGNATITATTEDGSKTATCNVTVIVPVVIVPADGVSLDKSAASINIGATEVLTATVSPANVTNNNVTWSSSNTSVATVSETGVVTGVAKGSALITATTVDGGFTATCVVDVTVPVSGISLNKSTAEIKAGNTEALTATVTPGDAANKTVTWSSSNTSVATVDNTGVVTAVAAGNAIITATTEDGGFTATCAVTVPAASGSSESGSSGGGGYVPPATYDVVAEIPVDADGNVTLSNNNASKGETITVTVTPNRYYSVENLVIKDADGNEIPVTDNGNGTYTFKMPDTNVTIEPSFSWDNPFVDVADDTYYTDAVEWALKNNITSGTTEDTFSPSAPCTRAQMATFLWHAAGSPEPKNMSSFTDITDDSYYAKAVAWAVENGITWGTGDGSTFSPDDTCTRAQMATFLFRMANGTIMSSYNPFTDVSADAYYAIAVQWAAENNITSGTGDGSTFSPDAVCTRGDMMVFLFNFFA